MSNVCSWTAPLVMLVDGRQVRSDSEEYRAECEARHMLALPLELGRDQRGETRKTMLEAIGRRRGDEALAVLKSCMDAVEPAYVLALPNRYQRNAYVEAIRRTMGENTAEHLRNRVMNLHAERKASIVTDSASSA